MTEFREGKSLAEIATSLNDAGIPRLDADSPWDEQNVAYIVNRFTQKGTDNGIGSAITRCQKCSQAIFDSLLATSVCSACQAAVEVSTPIPSKPMAPAILLFNGIVIGGLILFIVLCQGAVSDGDGFNSHFGAFFLSIAATAVAGIVWLVGNAAFVLSIIFRKKK